MANERQTLSVLANQVRMSTSRATCREFDDDHDMQQIKHADVYHSETPSDFERWQMVGLTATPLKQDEDDKQQQSKQSQKKGGSDDGDWNHDQPKGPAAEAIMIYPGGARSHPIGMVDDRRVRPYKLPEGATALYAASGTGQMFYHDDNGSYTVITNNPKYGKNQQQKERFASVRHVEKKTQERKFKSSQGGSGGGSGGGGSSVGGLSVGTLAAGGSGGGGSGGNVKHEGDSINTEVRFTKKTMEFRDSDTNIVNQYQKDSGTWQKDCKNIKENVSQVITTNAQTINRTATTINYTADHINGITRAYTVQAEKLRLFGAGVDLIALIDQMANMILKLTTDDNDKREVRLLIEKLDRMIA